MEQALGGFGDAPLGKAALDDARESARSQRPAL